MHLIFDFDGTLVDSFYCVMQTLNLFAEDYHYRKINLNNCAALKNLSSQQLTHYLEIPPDKLTIILDLVKISSQRNA